MRGPASIPRRTRPPIGYHSGASVTAWATTWRSRQHSARRLSRWNDVLPPCRNIRSMAWRALSVAYTAARRRAAVPVNQIHGRASGVGGVARGQPATGPLLEGGVLAGRDGVPELG